MALRGQASGCCTVPSRQEKQVPQHFVSLATSLRRGRQDLGAFLIGGNFQDHLQQFSDLFHLHLTGWSQFFLELDEAGALLPRVKGEVKNSFPAPAEALGSLQASHPAVTGEGDQPGIPIFQGG